MANPDEVFMERGLELAAKAKVAGKTAVGSIVVKAGEIISEGIEGNAGSPALLAHAEILAIIDAVNKVGSNDLSDCILYTTVEPCIMCSYVIRQTQLSKVIYGAEAGEIGGATGTHRVLLTQDIPPWSFPPIIEGGIKKDDCLRLLRKFK